MHVHGIIRRRGDFEARRCTRFAVLVNRRKSVVGRNEHIGRPDQPERFQRGEESGKGIVRVPDARFSGWTVDAWCELAKAILLDVLRAVGIAGPEDNDKRLPCVFESRQHDLRRDLEQVLLLRVVWCAAFRRYVGYSCNLHRRSNIWRDGKAR